MSVRLQALIQCDECGDEPDWKYPPEVQWDRFPLIGTSLAGEIEAKAIGMLTTKGWVFDESGVNPRITCHNCKAGR